MAATGRKVLIPVDASDHSMRAFEWYRDHVRHDSDVVLFVHCVEPPSLKSVSLRQPLSIPTEEWAAAINQNIESGRKIENKFVVECQRVGIKQEFFCLTGKNPGESICDFANEQEISMIIIGNRGIGKLRRTFLGSCSDYVIHHIQVPVTIVPPKK